MSYFDNIQYNMQIDKILKKYQNFDQFYYNIKKIMNSTEFKTTGSGFVSNLGLSLRSFHRKIHFDNYTVHVDSGLICTTISLQEGYYRSIQCSAIVKRHSSNKSDSSNSYERCQENKKLSTDKDDTSTHPLNPSNPMSW